MIFLRGENSVVVFSFGLFATSAISGKLAKESQSLRTRVLGLERRAYAKRTKQTNKITLYFFFLTLVSKNIRRGSRATFPPGVSIVVDQRRGEKKASRTRPHRSRRATRGEIFSNSINRFTHIHTMEIASNDEKIKGRKTPNSPNLARLINRLSEIFSLSSFSCLCNLLSFVVA